MKKLFLLAWPIALAAVSCSNEEVVSVNNDANEIKFTAVAENATRANTAETFCAYKLPASFNVWALATDADSNVKSYFEGIEYSSTDNTTWTATDQANIHFWPSKGADKLNFYAMRNHNGTVGWDINGATEKLKVTGFTLGNDVAAQTDFIYSVETDQVKTNNNGTINLNFRHALSQVVFKARNTNSSLHIEIGEVTVKNFYSKGDFALPLASTKKNLVDHPSTGNTAAPEGTVGKWSNQNTLANTNVAVYATTVEGQAEATYAAVNYDTAGTDATNLTNGKDNSAADRDFSKAMLFIPQKREKGTVTPGNALTADNSNPYFVVKCKIWNINGAAFNKDKDVCIYDGDAYIPVDATWEEGKKYIYTFVFGKANGGYDPNGYDVLVPISFTVTVDDFTPVVEKDVYVDNVNRTNP